jgi:hypothetical protein
MHIMAHGVMTWGCFAPIKWQDQPLESDAITCFMIGYLPLIPMKQWHVSILSGDDFTGMDCNGIRLKFRFRLLAHLYLRFFMFFAAFGLIAAFLIPIFMSLKHEKTLMIVLPLFDLILAFCLYCLSQQIAKRQQAILLILGPSFAGLGDPATWDPSIVDNFQSQYDEHHIFWGKEAPEIDSNALERMSREMLEARLMAGSDNVQAGEDATDEILQRLNAIMLVNILRKRMKLWKYF